MPSHNSEYSKEMRTQTDEHILRSGKPETGLAEEFGIDTNTVCRWGRDYRSLGYLSPVKYRQKYDGLKTA